MRVVQYVPTAYISEIRSPFVTKRDFSTKYYWIILLFLTFVVMHFCWHGNSKSLIVSFWINMTNFLAVRIARNIVIGVLSRNLMFTLLEIQGQKLSLCNLI